MEQPRTQYAEGKGGINLAYQVVGDGPMAMLFAATYPERVTALMLYSTFATTRKTEDVTWTHDTEERAALVERLTSEWGSGRRLGDLAPSLAGDERVVEWWGKLER